MHQQQTAFENITCNKLFLLFPKCFQLNQKIVSPFVNMFDISLFAAELEEPKIGAQGKGLNWERGFNLIMTLK